MLPYVLALVIGLGSFAFYMAAFFFPEVHRKSDFIWSGVGLFYALVLWVCAGRITGAVLLSQMASVSLLGWLGWQTLTLRQELTPLDEKTEISPEMQAKLANPSVGGLGGQLLQPVTSLFRRKPIQTTIPSTAPVPETVAPTEVVPEDVRDTETPMEEVVAVEASPTEAIEEIQDTTIPVEETEVNQTSPAEVTEVRDTEQVEVPSIDETEETTPPVDEVGDSEAEPVVPEPVKTVSPAKGQPKQRRGSGGFLQNLFGKRKPQAKTPTTPTKAQPLPEEAIALADDTIPVEVTPVDETDATESTAPETVIVEVVPDDVTESETPQTEPIAEETKTSESPQLIPPNPPDPELVEAAQKSPDPLQSGETAATPVEDIAPEVQLSPPAEPIGEGESTVTEHSVEDLPPDSQNPSR